MTPAQKQPIDDPAEQAHRELLNWAYCNHDGWLSDHALYAVPPTSDQYRAPIVDTDDDPPPPEPLDFQLAAHTENIVVNMGLEGCLGFERYRVLVYYYTRLMVAHLALNDPPLIRPEAIKRLSKHMHTSYPGAERMLREAQERYWQRRFLTRADDPGADAQSL